MTFLCPVEDYGGQLLKEGDHHVVYVPLDVRCHAQPGRELEQTGELQKEPHGKNCARHHDHHRSHWEREADEGAAWDPYLLHGGTEAKGDCCCGWESTNPACRNGCVEWSERDALPGERTLQGDSGDPRTTCHRFLDDLHVGSGIRHSWWTKVGQEGHHDDQSVLCAFHGWRVWQDETKWTLGCGCCNSKRRGRFLDT